MTPAQKHAGVTVTVLTTGATVAVTRQCFCADAPLTATSCSLNCADGDYPMMYTHITGSMPYTNFGGNTSTLNATQKVRTR